MQCGIADAMLERGCVESDEISRSNETKSRDRELFPVTRGFGWRFTHAEARDVAAGGPLDTRRAPK